MSIDKTNQNSLRLSEEIKRQENEEESSSVFDNIEKKANTDLESVLERTEAGVEQVRQKEGTSEEDVSEAKNIGQKAEQESQEAGGEFTKEIAAKELENLPPEKKKRFLEGFANLGFRTTEMKSKIIGNFLNKISNNTKNKRLSTFFGEYENIYKKLGENAKNSRMNVGKGVISRFSGLGQGAGNIIKYTRVLYDLNVMNPLRHVMAASMFVGRTSEAVKETRFQSEEIKEKTRVDDFDRAAKEAWRIYEEAKTFNNGEKPKAEDLNKEYKKQLPKDLQERLNRVDGAGIGFISSVLNKDVKWAVDSLQKKFQKIETNDELSLAQKEAEIQTLLNRNKAFLEDLDRMVADQGMIDNIAYYSRLSEKAGKATATVMMIDSVARFARMAPQIFEKLESWGLEISSAQADEVKVSVEEGEVASGNAEVSEGEAEKDQGEKPVVEEVSSVGVLAPKAETPTVVESAHRQAMEGAGEIKRGDSVWTVSGRYLDSRLEDKLGKFADNDKVLEAYKTYYTDKLKDVIVKNPSGYGLPTGKAFHQLSIEDLKGLNLEKAFDDASLAGDEKVLDSNQIKNIINNNNKLKDFFEKNPKAPRSIENFNAILEGKGQILPDAEINNRLSGIESQTQAQVSKQIDEDIKDIFVVKRSRFFRYNHMHEWEGTKNTKGLGIKDLSASKVLKNSFGQADFGRFGENLDDFQQQDRKKLFDYLSNLKQDSNLEPNQNETVEQYIKRAQTEIALRENERYQNLLNQRENLGSGSEEAEVEIEDEKVEIKVGLQENHLDILKEIGFEYDSESKAIKFPGGFENSKGERAKLTLEPGEEYIGVNNREDGALRVKTIQNGEKKEYVVRIDKNKNVYFNEKGQEQELMRNITYTGDSETSTAEIRPVAAENETVPIERELVQSERAVLGNVKLFTDGGDIDIEAKGELVKLIFNNRLEEAELINYLEKNYQKLHPNGNLPKNFNNIVKDIFSDTRVGAINMRLDRLAEAIKNNNFEGFKSLETEPSQGPIRIER